MIESFPDGRQVQTNADGTRIERFADGRQIQTDVSGTVLEQLSDGKSSHKFKFENQDRC